LLLNSRESTFVPTCIGLLAPVLWSLPALILIEIRSVPTFQALTIVMFFSFISSSSIIYLKGDQSLSNLKIKDWVVGVLGLSCNQIFYVLGIKYAPPEHAELIYYLWPIMLVFFSGLFYFKSFSSVSLLGALLSFSGVVLVVGFNWEDNADKYLVREGYLFSFGAALGWSVYTLYSRINERNSPYLLGIASGFVCVFCFILHIFMETTAPLTLYQFFLMVVFGAGVISFSLLFWDYGIKNGNFQLLAKASFMTPLLTVYLLVWLGKAPYHPTLVLAAILVFAGCLLSIKNSAETLISTKTSGRAPKSVPDAIAVPVVIQDLENLDRGGYIRRD